MPPLTLPKELIEDLQKALKVFADPNTSTIRKSNVALDFFMKWSES